MKILKIELQNINSLKSQEPIVIDFESSLFQDVGLYAITGPTGAGKTTILDAITIAMYHKVPRFNKSNIKAGLEDVVSKGSATAMSRITFKSKDIRYEATWSIKVKSANGKTLVYPQEEIRLKNLDSQKIIAEKKREFIHEIEAITQLNYNQFLRSAMLAQGEFAAFLSASAKDKGTLLEQITGEEIYKKIGEEIGVKINSEKKLLEQIKAKINTDDLLGSEDIELLNEEKEQLDGKIKEIEDKLKQHEKIITWFAKEKQFNDSNKKLDEDFGKLNAQKEKHKEIIERLKVHERAEPFKDLVTELVRIESEIELNNKNIEKLKAELIKNQKEIEDAKNREKILKSDFDKKEIEQQSWQAKLEEVTGLDTRMSNLQEAKNKAEANSAKRVAAISGLNKTIREETIKKQQAETEFGKLEEYLQKNIRSLELKEQLTNWTASFTQLQNAGESISKTKQKIRDAEGKEKETKDKLSVSEVSCKKAEENLDELQKLSDSLSKKLKESNLTALLKKQKELSAKTMQTKDLLLLSDDVLELTNKQSDLTRDNSEIKKSKEKFSKEIEDLRPKISEAEKSLADAEKILELERNIKSFEEERTKLEADKPCPLCGSKEHPFVVEYKENSLSEFLIEVKVRKEKLEDLRKARQGEELKFAAVKQQLTGNVNALADVKFKIVCAEKKFKELNSDYDIIDNKSIASNLANLKSKDLEMSEEITLAQAIQAQKDGNEILLKTQQKSADGFKNNKTVLSEQFKGLLESLVGLKNDLKIQKEYSAKIESGMKSELFEFDLLLPQVKDIAVFMQSLKLTVAEYEKATKKHSEIKNSISNLQIDIKNIKKQIDEKTDEEETEQKGLTIVVVDLLKYTNNRQAILPLNTSTETKRKELQQALKQSKDALERANKILNDLNTQKATKEKEKANDETDSSKLQINLVDNNSKLSKQMSKSPFFNRLEIEKGLLSVQDKTTYVKIKKELDDKNIELQTLKTKLSQEITQLENEKDFDIPLEEAKESFEEIGSQKTKLTERTGEIKEKFKLDQQIRDRNKGVMDEIAIQEEVLTKWNKLFALLGGSKDAFNTYVQRLTLQSLIQIANSHLANLNPRYSLKMMDNYKKGEELNFNLIDHYQTDEMRVVDTSSGGEKFLISLALALGLSDLASKNINIESLFIDEGFGTLDSGTLETVISTLETLQAQGKMIGVISHVENLKERIPSQIQVTKKRNGISEVEVV